MKPTDAGRAMRAIRQRRGQRLADVALVARVSPATASRAERGEWDGLTWRAISALAGALDAKVDLDFSWHGAELDRVLDEGHAQLVGLVVARLEASGWATRVEVSYSIYGERGSIDILGWNAASATLLVVEVKTELGSVEGLLRPLDAKVRLAPQIARDQFGWVAARVGRIVVFPEIDSVRRLVARHASVFDVALPARSLEVRRWIGSPAGALRGLWFASISRQVTLKRNPSAIRRVRVPRTAKLARGHVATERGRAAAERGEAAASVARADSGARSRRASE